MHDSSGKRSTFAAVDKAKWGPVGKWGLPGYSGEETGVGIGGKRNMTREIGEKGGMTQATEETGSERVSRDTQRRLLTAALREASSNTTVNATGDAYAATNSLRAAAARVWGDTSGPRVLPSALQDIL